MVKWGRGGRSSKIWSPYNFHLFHVLALVGDGLGVLAESDNTYITDNTAPHVTQP